MPVFTSRTTSLEQGQSPRAFVLAALLPVLLASACDTGDVEPRVSAVSVMCGVAASAVAACCVASAGACCMVETGVAGAMLPAPAGTLVTVASVVSGFLGLGLYERRIRRELDARRQRALDE